MNIVIHAGMQKTGSTAIQAYLDAQRIALAGIGISYPYFRHRSHHLIAKALARDPVQFHRLAALSREDDTSKSAVEALAALRQILRDPAVDNLVLSHEGFSVGTIAKSLARVIRDDAPSDGSVRVIAYVRNPVDHYPSAVQNALRTASARIAPPSRWRSTHPTRAKVLLAAFGDRVVVRLFSRTALKDGDVVADFGSILNRTFHVTVPKHPVATNNSSLSGAACCLLYMARAMPSRALRGESFGVLRSRIARADAEIARPKLSIPTAWRIELAARHHEAWNRIVPLLSMSNDEQRGVLISEDRISSRPTSNRDLHEWLMSYFDQALVDAVVARISTSDRKGAETVCDWLAGTSVARATGFNPDPAIFVSSPQPDLEP